MNKKLIIENTRKYVYEKSCNDVSGHDYFHIERVMNMAIYLGKKENADLFIVQMAALLHDIDDWKFKDEINDSLPNAELYLNSQDIDDESIKFILDIIRNISFKGGISSLKETTIEGMVVQDADRLDAIGAIGIARAFAYGGYKNRPIYDPNIKPYKFKSLEEVKNNNSHTINHFYEKLLKLKDLMNTQTAKDIAQERHDYMLEFLDEFFNEWNYK